jgi:hypothetical protein
VAPKSNPLRRVASIQLATIGPHLTPQSSLWSVSRHDECHSSGFTPSVLQATSSDLFAATAANNWSLRCERSSRRTAVY